MSKEKKQILARVYFDTECYEMGYLAGIEEYKEALKKEIESEIEFDIISKSTASYFNDLIDTVKPPKE